MAAEKDLFNMEDSFHGGNNADALLWWKVHSKKYLNLPRNARDYVTT